MSADAILSARFSVEDAAAVRAYASAVGCSASDLIRRAVMDLLTPPPPRLQYRTVLTAATTSGAVGWRCAHMTMTAPPVVVEPRCYAGCHMTAFT